MAPSGVGVRLLSRRPESRRFDTHFTLRRDFDARWVLVEPGRNPRFFAYLARDPGYRPAFSTGTVAIFEVIQ